MEVLADGRGDGRGADEGVEGGDCLRQLLRPHLAGDAQTDGAADGGDGADARQAGRGGAGRDLLGDGGGEPQADPCHTEGVAHARRLLLAEARNRGDAACARGERDHPRTARPAGSLQRGEASEHERHGHAVEGVVLRRVVGPGGGAAEECS